jgi:hypothetical protein
MSWLHSGVMEVTDQRKQGLHFFDFLLEFSVLESSFDNFLGHSFDLGSQVLVDFGQGVNRNVLPR